MPDRSAILAACALALLLALPAAARAQVPARVIVEGACPTEDELRAALVGLVADPDAQAWELRVRAEEGGAVLELHDADGALALRRRLTHEVCAELAEGFAVILHAHLLDLRLVTEDARVRAVDAGAVGTEPAPAREPELEPPSPPPPRPAPERTHLAIAIVGMGGATFTPTGLVAGAGLDLELRPAGSDLTVRIEGLAHGYGDQEGDAGQVSFRAIRAGALLSWRFARDRTWVAPALGAGVTALWVSAGDLEGQPSVQRLQAAFGAGLEVGHVLAGPLFVRAALRGDVLPFGDRYRVEPIGTVAFSPRWLVYGTLALGVDLSL